MTIKTILFDLDGTLLPMDLHLFAKYYSGALFEKFVPLGYDQESLIRGLRSSIKAMMINDGSKTNEEVFWESFCAGVGRDCRCDKPVFESFYANEFSVVKNSCQPTEKAKELIDFIKASGRQIILATNPMFPPVATKNRIGWAGLSTDDFVLITTYDNSHYCKPNPKYYVEIMEKLDLKPEECLMVGNNAEEDMIAETLGMKVFLLTDCLINEKNIDISNYPQGGFEKLKNYILTLCY